MTSMKYSSQQAPQLSTNHHHHMQFAPHQAAMSRVHSLRKVEPERPTFTPDIH